MQIATIQQEELTANGVIEMAQNAIDVLEREIDLKKEEQERELRGKEAIKDLIEVEKKALLAQIGGSGLGTAPTKKALADQCAKIDTKFDQAIDKIEKEKMNA